MHNVASEYMKKLSVIIPVYNAERYFSVCLSSVARQTFRDYELIVVDDGSTDSSQTVFYEKKSSFPSVKYVKQLNFGSGVARNEGLRLASGKYVMFLDADDMLCSENVFEDMVRRADETDCEFLIAHAQGLSRTGEDKGMLEWVLRADFVPCRDVFAGCEVGENLYSICGAVPWAKLFRMDFIRRNDLKFPLLRRSEDFPFVQLALSYASRIAVLDKPVVVHRDGVTSSLENRKDVYPCSFIEAESWFREELEKRRLPKVFLAAARKRAEKRALYNVSSMKTLEGLRSVYEGIRAFPQIYRDACASCADKSSGGWLEAVFTSMSFRRWLSDAGKGKLVGLTLRLGTVNKWRRCFLWAFAALSCIATLILAFSFLKDQSLFSVRHVRGEDVDFLGVDGASNVTLTLNEVSSSFCEKVRDDDGESRQEEVLCDSDDQGEPDGTSVREFCRNLLTLAEYGDIEDATLEEQSQCFLGVGADDALSRAGSALCRLMLSPDVTDRIATVYTVAVLCQNDDAVQDIAFVEADEVEDGENSHDTEEESASVFCAVAEDVDLDDDNSDDDLEQRMVRALISAGLSDPESDVRDVAFWALSKLPEEDRTFLSLQLLGNDDDQLKVWALDATMDKDDEFSLTFNFHALASDNDEIRKIAQENLLKKTGLSFASSEIAFEWYEMMLTGEGNGSESD